MTHIQALDDGEKTEVQMWWMLFSLRRKKVKWADRAGSLPGEWVGLAAPICLPSLRSGHADQASQFFVSLTLPPHCRMAVRGERKETE
jgi:hypothetical protein